MSCNSFSLINRSFLLHTARKYCFLPKKFLVPFILNFSNSDAWLRLPVSITIISKFQHPAAEWEVEIHSRAHLARTNRQFLFRFPFALCFLLEVHFWEIVQGSLFMASVNAASNVSVGMDEHVNRSLAGQEESARFRLNLWIHKPEAPRCTWPAGDGGREGVLRLTTCFFSLFDIQPSLSLPAGSRKVTAKPFFWLGFCNTRFWPPEELLSLWHMLRRSIISLFLILSHTLSVLSDLSSQGLVKLPGRNKSKRWTGPVSPVSHKLLQTFLFH